MFKHVNRIVICLLTICLTFLMSGCGQDSWERHIVKEEIFLPGITGEYDFLFLTDTHVIASTKKQPKEVYDGIWERKAQFVNEKGVSSAEQFPGWIDYANKENVEGLFLGGDVIDSPGETNLAFLADQFDALEVPFLYTPGNHDWTMPHEYMTQKAYEEYLPRLHPFMKENPAIQKMDVGELRILAVDNSSGQFSQDAVEAYETYLKTDKPVIVLIHVPLITQSVLANAREVWASPVVLGAGNYGGIYPDEFSQKLMDLTTAADSPVELVLAGHVHFYDKDYIEGEKKVLQIVGPAGYEGSAIHLFVKSSDTQ